MIAGASAGVSSSVITCPLDVVKTTLQAQGKSQPGVIPYDGLTGEIPSFSLCFFPSLSLSLLLTVLCLNRDDVTDIQRGRRARSVSWTGTDGVRLSADMGNLLYCL
jgi:hypothetical protein